MTHLDELGLQKRTASALSVLTSAMEGTSVYTPGHFKKRHSVHCMGRVGCKHDISSPFCSSCVENFG